MTELNRTLPPFQLHLLGYNLLLQISLTSSLTIRTHTHTHAHMHVHTHTGLILPVAEVDLFPGAAEPELPCCACGLCRVRCSIPAPCAHLNKASWRGRAEARATLVAGSSGWLLSKQGERRVLGFLRMSRWVSRSPSQGRSSAPGGPSVKGGTPPGAPPARQLAPADTAVL